MTKVIEEAERVLSIALARWQGEFDPTIESGDETRLTAILTRDISHCLLAFRIDEIKRLPIELHDAPKPITDYFIADVTLTVTPRPHVRMSLAEMRAKAVDSNIDAGRYFVKCFVDDTWLVMAELE